VTGPGAYLISGIPGAGKTSVARALAARLERSVHIEGDLVGRGFIVSGLVPPEGDPRDEAERQLLLRRNNIILLANSFASEGFAPVIDDVVVSPSVLAQYLELLEPRPLVMVQLTPDVDVVGSRDAERDKHVFEIWSHLDAELRSTMRGVGLWIDSGDMTALETVDAILARAAEGVIA
jgi:predicted kinase